MKPNYERVAIDSLKLDPRNARKQYDRFMSKVIKSESGCWEFREIAPHTGYGKFHSYGITWRAHRWIMWHLQKIEYKSEICVLHLCDNRCCVNPEHLYLGDRKQNAQDIKDRNRSHLIRDPKLGSKNHQSKLSEDNVINIRSRILTGEKSKNLAFEFGVSPVTISNIKTGKIWRQVK